MKRLILASARSPLLFGGSALAQTYPARPIRLVVGYTPGGGNDLIARIVAARLQDKLGQPVVVDNKPGAQSIVAAELVAKAAPDGYTLLIAPSGPLTINPAVYAKLPYTIRSATSCRSRCWRSSRCCWRSAPSSRSSRCASWSSTAAPIPKLANYASSATPFQLAAELFNQRTGSKFQHIPYRGSGDAVQAVMAGQVLMTLADSGPMAGPIKGGKLRALALTAAKRNPAFPDVPTMAEAGIPDMDISLWTGIVAPVGTPAEIVALLQKAIADTIALPEVRAALEGDRRRAAQHHAGRISRPDRPRRGALESKSPPPPTSRSSEEQMDSNEARHSAAHYFLEGLNEIGFDYLFCNFGTDHAPLIEAMACLQARRPARRHHPVSAREHRGAHGGGLCHRHRARPGRHGPCRCRHRQRGDGAAQSLPRPHSRCC